jgi:cytoskeletal protein RodZ
MTYAAAVELPNVALEPGAALAAGSSFLRPNNLRIVEKREKNKNNQKEKKKRQNERKRKKSFSFFTLSLFFFHESKLND